VTTLRAAALALLLPAAAAAAGALTPAETRGREIYLHGRSAAGRAIGAFFGADEGSEIAASVLPCASCHGTDGRGVSEGTVAPADIRGSVLGAPFVAADGVRRRTAYDAATLARAVREAVDAGGSPLSAVMPHYRIDDRDLDDLLAYLRRLGNEPQPGLDDAAISIATIVPLSGPRAPIGEAVRGAVGGLLDDINAQGGLFGRKLKLAAIDAAAPPKRIAEALRGEIFAVAGASWSDGNALDDVVRDERIPFVSPFAAGAESRGAPSAFFIFPDLESQALALIDFAAERAGTTKPAVAIVDDHSRSALAAAAAVTRRCASLGWKVVPKVTRELGPHDLVLLAGSGVDAQSVIAGIDGPQVLVAGAAMTKALFDLRGKTIFVAVPTLPSDMTEEGQREFASFAERHHLSPAHRAAEIAAYAAAKVLIEGLRRGGHDLTREKLIASLEHLYEFHTELTPPVTYGPSRHVGALGAYVVAVDLDRHTFVPAGRWITPAE
jgi:ABC-type branched-subunit amino acid transport system substrate-binding protein